MLPVWLVAGLALALTLAPDFAGGAAAERVPRPDTATRVIAAAGDIACDPTGGAFHGGRGTADACHMRAVSDLLLDLDPALVLTLGDNQYENGTLTKYRRSYAPTWGRLKARTRPSPGNHEYNTKGAAGYYDYFGSRAGNRATGWYSFDLGAWHLIALNSECAKIGGCGATSPQVRWLRADLAAHPTACTLAYWHKPRFSSGQHGDDPAFGAFWRALDAAGADVVLSGHDHDYERFAPQSPAGRPDPKGIREFVVGTGGKTHYGFRTIRRNSQVRNTGTFGILELRLAPGRYSWRFRPEPGKTFSDHGSGRCH